MTYRTIHVFEKQGANLTEVLPSAPGLDSCSSFFFGSEHVELFEERAISDFSYIEYHIYFFDEANYLEWHRKNGSMHDSIRNGAYEVLELIGVDIKRYWETTDLSAPGSLPIEEFTSKYSPLTHTVGFVYGR
jgi:hypothetical protein